MKVITLIWKIMLAFQRVNIPLAFHESVLIITSSYKDIDVIYIFIFKSYQNFRHCPKINRIVLTVFELGTYVGNQVVNIM